MIAEMVPYLGEHFGNAHSIHSWGRKARQGVDLARQRVADLIGAENPQQIVFTSGATESCNWVIRSFSARPGFVSPFEHSAGLDPAVAASYEVLEHEGLELFSPTSDGERRLLSVMAVNNEIGARWDVRSLSQSGLVLHSDITQQAGKFPTDVSGLDYASLSSHKFYGPKGVGALFMADTPLEPLLLGGDQEEGYRSGTLNVPGIVGMGAAAAIAMEELDRSMVRASTLRAIVLEEIKGVSDWIVNGGSDASPFILSISFAGVEGETLVIEADASGFAISSGAACSSGSTEPSHVLTALGLEEEWLRGTIRISFGRFNTEESARALARSLITSVDRLRRLG